MVYFCYKLCKLTYFATIFIVYKDIWMSIYVGGVKITTYKILFPGYIEVKRYGCFGASNMKVLETANESPDGFIPGETMDGELHKERVVYFWYYVALINKTVETNPETTS